MTDNKIWEQFAENSGFYSYELSTRVTLVSLNTNLWYKSNKYVQDDPDPGHQFQWLETTLATCRQQGSRVLIIGHIPPGKFERFYQRCDEYKGCDTHGGYYGFHWLKPEFNQR